MNRPQISAPAGCLTQLIPVNGTNHANYACSGGVAVITSCQTGWTDANGQVSDGCEALVGDPDAVGNSQADAVYLGEKSCVDFPPPVLVSGTIAGQADHDWYRITATGGSCLNDFLGVLTAAPGIAFDVITDRNTVVNRTGTFSVGPVFYTTGTEVWIQVHALPGATELGSYSLRVNL